MAQRTSARSRSGCRRGLVISTSMGGVLTRRIDLSFEGQKVSVQARVCRAGWPDTERLQETEDLVVEKTAERLTALEVVLPFRYEPGRLFPC